jgi:hypothetical protein
MLQSLLRCAFEIQECVANQKRFPEERDLAILGEMDAREWMYEMIQLLEKR